MDHRFTNADVRYLTPHLRAAFDAPFLTSVTLSDYNHRLNFILTDQNTGERFGLFWTFESGDPVTDNLAALLADLCPKRHNFLNQILEGVVKKFEVALKDPLHKTPTAT